MGLGQGFSRKWRQSLFRPGDRGRNRTGASSGTLPGCKPRRAMVGCGDRRGASRSLQPSELDCNTPKMKSQTIPSQLWSAFPGRDPRCIIAHQKWAGGDCGGWRIRCKAVGDAPRNADLRGGSDEATGSTGNSSERTTAFDFRMARPGDCISGTGAKSFVGGAELAQFRIFGRSRFPELNVGWVGQFARKIKRLHGEFEGFGRYLPGGNIRLPGFPPIAVVLVQGP